MGAGGWVGGWVGLKGSPPLANQPVVVALHKKFELIQFITVLYKGKALPVILFWVLRILAADILERWGRGVGQWAARNEE